MAIEKHRLSEVKVSAGEPIYKESIRLTGQEMKKPQSATLEDILKRPHVHYGIIEKFGFGPKEVNPRSHCIK